jgi:hypothetical protein
MIGTDWRPLWLTASCRSRFLATRVRLKRATLIPLLCADCASRRFWGPHRFVNNAITPSNGYRVVLAFNPALDSANAPAAQEDAQAESTDRHAITLCNGTMAIHANGPYPPLPIKRLERIRARTDQVWSKYLAERVLVRGALCLGNVPISSGFVERPALEEYDDPEFDQILSLLLLRLMPFRGPA